MDKIKALRQKFDNMRERRSNTSNSDSSNTSTDELNYGNRLTSKPRESESKVHVVPIKLEVPKVAPKVAPKPVRPTEAERKGSSSHTDRKSSISEEKLHELEEAFHLFDMNRDGMISKEELGAVLYALGQRPTVTDVQEMIKSVDIDRNGKIDFDEFVKIFSMKLSIDPEEELHEVFCIFDQNSDGFITADELYEMLKKLGESITQIEAQKMIREADINRDGKVDYKEFKAILNAR